MHASFAAAVYSGSEASVCPCGSSAISGPKRLLPAQRPVGPGVPSARFLGRPAPCFFRFFLFEFGRLCGRRTSAAAQCLVALKSCSYSCFASGHRLSRPSTGAAASSRRHTPCTRLPQYSLLGGRKRHLFKYQFRATGRLQEMSLQQLLPVLWNYCNSE